MLSKYLCFDYIGKVWLQGKPGSQCLEGKDSKFEHLCNVKENKHIDCNKAHT